MKLIVPLAAMLLSGLAAAADQPQWGQAWTRNMVSTERGLPARFDPQRGENVKWSVPLGTQCYATPVVAGDRVLVGTNNDEPRDPARKGDRGVLLCLRAGDGGLAWQLLVPKLDSDPYLDWPRAGMCSPPTVEGERIYTVTNRDEVVCLDLQGLANGNDGPFQDEGRHMTPHDQPLQTPGAKDADILWLLDLRAAGGVRPHDSAHSSILVDGDYLYVNTSNGLNSKHSGVDKPEAPSLVVVDKRSGQLVAQEREGISRDIFHCTWSSPAMAELDGRRLVVFCGGSSVCYAFEPWRGGKPSGSGVGTLKLGWRFDCDPTAPKENIHSYIRNRQVSPSNIKSMPVVLEGRVYVTHGGDIWWGKHQAWLKCFDARGQGDITGSALLWSYPVQRHCCSTPAVCEGLAYVGDCSGKVHCVDARTGSGVWVHDARGEIWASPLLADGKLYIGTRKGDFWILAAGREPRVLSSVRLDAGVVTTAVAANGTLYVAAMNRLYALAERTTP